MRIPRIYQPGEYSAGQSLSLDSEPANHVARVLRMSQDDKLIVFNGLGGQYPATIEAISKKNVSLVLGEHQNIESESPLSIHLGQGISRGDKMDFSIQKAVELGVTEITPLFTERCGVKLSGDRLDKKWVQWQKIVQSACEQCGRNTIPTVHPPIALDLWLTQPSTELKINLHPRATDTIKTLPTPTDGIRLIIGPEGGLSEAEIARTVEHQFSEITLGPRILRTETAGLTVISALQLQFGDLA